MILTLTLTFISDINRQSFIYLGAQVGPVQQENAISLPCNKSLINVSLPNNILLVPCSYYIDHAQ